MQIILGLWFNAWCFQLECAKVLYESLLIVPVLMYGTGTLISKEKDKASVKGVQMDNLRSLLGIRRIDKFPNARIRDLWQVTKEVDERIDEGVIGWFGHVENMESDMIARRVYVEECTGSLSVPRPRKSWTDTVKECLRKRCFDIRQARRMVHHSNVWRL